MNIKLRICTAADTPRLQSALATWIHASDDTGYCHPGELAHHIYTSDQTWPPIQDRVLIWEDANEIAGIANTVLYDNAFELYVSPYLRGTGTERRMAVVTIQRTQALMAQIDSAAATIITDVFDTDMTRQRILESLGFGKYRVWTLRTERSLDLPIPEHKLPDGFAFHRTSVNDYAQISAIHDAAFGDYTNPEGFRDNVLRMPGYNPQDHIVVTAPDGRFAAFTHIWFDQLNEVGLFEPVATHPDFQRMGLARSLLSYAMGIMRQSGMERAQVSHTITNTGAYLLYQRLGFRRKHLMLGYATDRHEQF